MKIFFKVSGILIILMIGLIFLFYGQANRNFAKAENAYKHGDFETAKLFYEKGMGSFEKFPKIREKLKGASSLARAWSVYYQGYYDSEKYKLAEEIVNQELTNNNSSCKDQLYNLEALICWQKGVDLFIKKAATSKDLDQFLEEAKTSSGEAIKVNDGNDGDIKYNYEFFRKPKEELKKNMQQAAQQKAQDRETKKKAEQLAKEKKIKPNKQNQQGNQEKKMDKNKDNTQRLVPVEKKERDKATEETQNNNQKKKKKKG